MNNTTLSTVALSITSIGIRVIVITIPILTILINIPVVVFVIRSTIKKEKEKNLHLFSMGITDALIGVASLAMADSYIFRDRVFSYYDCKLRFYFYTVTFLASLLHVLGVCIQRVKIVMIKSHVQSQRATEWLVIASSWIISLVINAIAFCLWALEEEELDECSWDTVHSDTEPPSIYFGMIFLLTTVFVLITMLILFRLVCIKLKKNPNGLFGPKEKRMCATIAIMAVLFVLTTLPLSVVLLFGGENGENKRRRRSTCILISLLNSMINPIVYIYRIKEHRTKLRKTFCFWKQFQSQVYSVSGAHQNTTENIDCLALEQKN